MAARHDRDPLSRPALAGKALAAVVLLCRAHAVLGAQVSVDCSRNVGEIRPLHGVNNGPLNFGEVVDLSAHYREAKFPLARLHDCDWPDPVVVDMHAVFPDLAADPARPDSYRFLRTDDYIQAILDAGTGVVYRLGESIEWTRRKYHVAPPPDPDRWAQVCLGIIRHYNYGWAEGFQHNIRYWEIWNEPENRPRMWTGTDEQYYRLYAAAAGAIKGRFPGLMVGGPSAGEIGRLDNDRLVPTDFVSGFLDWCRQHEYPLDFFSWHTYTDDPWLYVRKARAVRRLLDERGFTSTENHLNEWNYLPDNDWSPLSRSGQGLRRQQWFDRIGGAPGAAFLACTLLLLQDTPVDVANYYSGDTNLFGLFNRHGVPKKTFHAMKAFRMLLDTPLRVAAEGSRPGRSAVCAGTSRDRDAVTVLLACLRDDDGPLGLVVDHLPWQTATRWEAFRLDATHDLAPDPPGTVPAGPVRLELACQAPCVLLVRLTPAPPRDAPK